MSVVKSFIEGIVFAGEMAWETWWSLVLGFTIAGAVEAFVSEEKMSNVLGGSGVRELGLGTLFGAASSSCSFGAVATTKSLFKKGASPIASLAAFQLASTNLVIELGLVMWILLGWEFVIADYVAGLILIVLLATIYNYIVPDEWFETARENLRSKEGMRDSSDRSHQSAWKDRLLTTDGWKNASRNAIGEWGMLKWDIIAGFLIAGLIGSFVPRSWWATVFGIGTEGTFIWVVASAVVGVVIGIVTFVCSVGNVPFAVILWNNGIAFGGVMSFIFADLIVPTIDDAYRRYYGARLATVLFITIFLTAVVSGVIIHYVWGAIGLIPQGKTGGTAPKRYTTVLNTVFTFVFATQVYITFFSGEEKQNN